MDLGIKNKVILITGTNNPEGIGTGTALKFCQRGANGQVIKEFGGHALYTELEAVKKRYQDN